MGWIWQKVWAVAAAWAVFTGGMEDGQPQKYLALTFDDGPTAGVTDALLDGLAQRYVSATFFLCGYRLETYDAPVARMVQEGHEIGIHGYSHQYLHTLEPAAIGQELLATAQMLENLGAEATLLRPPGGLLSDALRETARSWGLPVILWSVDTADWACDDAAAVAASIVEHARDGAIILLHDLQASSVQGALMAIDQLTAQGYGFCTVSELARLHGKSLTAGEVYGCFSRRP